MSISLTMFPRETVKFLKNERGFKVHHNDAGIYSIEGDIVPIQILESKMLPEKDNLFLRNLRSNLSAKDVQKTLNAYKKHKPLDNKSIFWDRPVGANSDAFMEAMSMFSEGVREIFLEGAEKYIHEGISLGEIKYCFTKLGRTVPQIAEEFGISEKDVMDALQQLQLA